MTNPVDYRTPLPQGRNLRFFETADGVRVSRDTVSRRALWREAIFMVIIFLLIAAVTAFQILWLFWHGHSAPSVLVFWHIAVLAAIPLIFLRVIRSAIQNAGIVSEIAVSQNTLFWRKETLWGTSEHFRPVVSIRLVDIDRMNRVLKVYRHRGVPLGGVLIPFNRRTGTRRRQVESGNRAKSIFGRAVGNG
jgi:uncharacterized integral membrane protein